MATTNNQAAFHLQLDGADITPVTKATNTGDWVVYDTIGGKTSTLAAGQHVLKLLVDSSYFDIDWLKFSQVDPSDIGVVKASTAYLPAGTYQVYNIIGSELVRWHLPLANRPTELCSVSRQCQAFMCCVDRMLFISYI